MTMITEPAPNFDSLARAYRLLEVIAFGRTLERARFCMLDRLAGCRDILVLGEGDGRCLARLVSAVPAARIHCVDASAAMLDRAARRIAGTEAARRVTFVRADAFAADFPPAGYDAVVTLFFLDCFRAEQVALLVERVAAAVKPGGLWLFADFAIPAAGLARIRARLVLAVLYAFFRWRTGLPARELPPSEKILCKAGFFPVDERSFSGGFIRSALLERR